MSLVRASGITVLIALAIAILSDYLGGETQRNFASLVFFLSSAIYLGANSGRRSPQRYTDSYALKLFAQCMVAGLCTVGVGLFISLIGVFFNAELLIAVALIVICGFGLLLLWAGFSMLAWFIEKQLPN